MPGKGQQTLGGLLNFIKPRYSRKATVKIHWKDWCWSWNSNTLATWYEEPTHWKRPWCWARLKAEGEGDDGGWDGWMASLTQWTWIWASSRSWWWIGRPGVLQSTGSQRVGHDWSDSAAAAVSTLYSIPTNQLMPCFQQEISPSWGYKTWLGAYERVWLSLEPVPCSNTIFLSNTLNSSYASCLEILFQPTHRPWQFHSLKTFYFIREQSRLTMVWDFVVDIGCVFFFSSQYKWPF